MAQKILLFVCATSLSMSLHSAALTLLTEEQQKKLDASCKLTKEWFHWDKRRPIIEKLIKEDAIHPDGIRYFPVQMTPLYDALSENDHPFVEFLLTSKANPNQMYSGSRRILSAARTVTTAQLMIKHGARVIEHHIDIDYSLSKFEPDLITFYAQNGGLDPAHLDIYGGTYLHAPVQYFGLVCKKDSKAMAIAIAKIEQFIKIGVPLNVKPKSGDMKDKTVPEWLLQQALEAETTEERLANSHMLECIIKTVNAKKEKEKHS
jgi:hypothetical protein